MTTFACSLLADLQDLQKPAALSYQNVLAAHGRVIAAEFNVLAAHRRQVRLQGGANELLGRHTIRLRAELDHLFDDRLP